MIEIDLKWLLSALCAWGIMSSLWVVLFNPKPDARNNVALLLLAPFIGVFLPFLALLFLPKILRDIWGPEVKPKG